MRNGFTAVAARHPLLLPLVIGGLLRLVWALAMLRAAPPGAFAGGGDQYSYWYYGTEIAKGHGYVSYQTHTATAFYPVGWPVLIAAVAWTLTHTPLPDSVPRGVGLLQVALSTASIWLLYVIVRRGFGQRTALVAAWVLALFPSMIFGTGTYSVETPFIAALLAVLALVVTIPWGSGSPSTRRLALIGVALAVAVEIRPFALPVAVALAAAMLVAGLGWRIALARLAVVAGVVAVLLAPWTVRNAVRLHAFVPFSTNLGPTMCLARFPGSSGGFHFADHEWCGDPQLPEAEYNSASIRRSLEFIRTYPGEEVRLTFSRFGGMIANDVASFDEATVNGRSLEGTALRAWLRTLANVTWIAALLAGLVGLTRWRRAVRDRRAGWATAITAAALLAIPLELWGAPRFHAPLVPFLAILVALAVAGRSAGLGPGGVDLGEQPVGDVGEPVTAEVHAVGP